jgi:hypothetical protein
MQALADATPRLQAVQEDITRLIELHPGSNLQEGLGRIRGEIASIARQLRDMLEQHGDRNRPESPPSTNT